VGAGEGSTVHTGEDRRDGDAPADGNGLLAEPRIRNALRRGDFSRWRRPGGGHCLREELVDGEPGRLFLFRLGTRWYAGYKTLSDYVLDHGMPGIFCSRLYWYNVVGLLETFRSSDSDARIVFHPLDEGERRAAFDGITPTTPIVHPFAKHGEPGREETGPEDGWPVTDERAGFLDLGEKHIRRYTRERFGPYAAALTRDVLAFDPACSTGHFLADFAALNPERIRTVGQDLGRQMADRAEQRLETVHHGDATHPRPAPGSVGILFCRFLNSEVVTTHQARQILPRLVATLCPGGTMVLVGHSPVLLDVLDLEAAGLHVLQTTARQDDHVFQYYVCEKQAD
jgi:isonocardicin synthase